MEFRQAKQDDLLPLLRMYEKIIQKMNAEGIPIWDDVYPCAYFAGDIEKGRFFVAQEGDSLAAGFALCDSNDGQDAVDWAKPAACACYLDRLGVSPEYAGQGVGGQMLSYAMALARQKGAAYLRLFVVDCNLPAIGLYRKSGFVQAGGVYEEQIDKDLSLREYGFEIRLLPMDPHPPSR